MAQYVTKIRTESGDLPIDYNALANLPKLNTMFSNPNLLINGDFRKPVNQREQTSYSIPANTYTIDRWKVLSDAATLTVNDGYIGISSDSVRSSYFIQKVESVPVDDHITVSINVKSLTGALNVYIASSTSQEECFSIYSSGIATYTTSAKFTDFMQLNIETINDAKVELYWAKVEQGSIATSFISKSYAQEVAECQRYYTKSDGVRAPVTFGTNSLFLMIPLSVTLRVAPTVTLGKTEIMIVRDESGEASTHAIGSCNVSVVTNTHLILEITSMYNVSVYKSGCVIEGLPIFIDAEIY